MIKIMKMKQVRIFLMVLLPVCSCAKNPIEDPVLYANKIARDNGISDQDYKLRSIRRFSNGDNSVIEIGQTDDFASNMRKKLSNEDYWEACYEMKKKGLGGEYCFYMRVKDGKVLFKYGGQ